MDQHAGQYLREMHAVAAVFDSTDAARAAVRALRAEGEGVEGVSLLTPDTPAREVERSVPIDEGESTGTGAAVGAVVGGALGLASASLVLPGVGTVVVAGLLGAGIVGAVGGNLIGEKLEERLSNGMPRDELEFYKEALREGCSVLIVVTGSGEAARELRNRLRRAGAHSVDPAHADWAVGLYDPRERPSCR